jgi:hypothetical protein
LFGKIEKKDLEQICIYAKKNTKKIDEKKEPKIISESKATT